MALFDEKFRDTREDQDLTHRARQVGRGFLYNYNEEVARAMLFRLVRIRERGHLAERALRRLYHLLVGLTVFRGWRDGVGTFQRRQAG